MDKMLRLELDWVTLSGVLCTWKEVTRLKFFKTNNLIQKTWVYVIDCLFFFRKWIHFLLTLFIDRSFQLKAGEQDIIVLLWKCALALEYVFMPAFPALNADLFAMQSHTVWFILTTGQTPLQVPWLGGQVLCVIFDTLLLTNYGGSRVHSKTQSVRVGIITRLKSKKLRAIQKN